MLQLIFVNIFGCAFGRDGMPVCRMQLTLPCSSWNVQDSVGKGAQNRQA